MSLFQGLRRRLLRNSLTGLLESSSPIRLSAIVVIGASIWVGVFLLSLEGFGFLRDNRIPFGANIVGLLFDLLFLSLALLLIFSTGLILYSSLFASAETAFLLTTPAAADQVFAYKLQGAVGFSSWAFLILGTPVLLAFGFISEAPWYFFALLPLFFLGFILLPGGVGAILCLVIVCLVPQRRKQLLAAIGVAVLVVAAVWALRVQQAMQSDFFEGSAGQLTDALSFVHGPLTPSHWMARGLQDAARGHPAEAGYRLALVWSNGLFVYVLATWLARCLYRRGYDRMATGGSLGRRPGGLWLDRLLSTAVGFLDPQTRLLMVKDFRTFRRDPAQWAQIAIFTGLLVLYFANTRRFALEQFNRAYQNGISLLNLFSVALLMCAYTGRFIYPLLSLEGRKFWVLGLLPMKRERLLWGKFAFSTVGTLLVAEVLIVISDLGLGMPPLLVGLHALAVAMLAVGLSGLSVGLGACMPNFRETDPSKIAIGFGGTLNLAACLLLLLLVIGLIAAPWHVTAAFAFDTDLADVSFDVVMAIGVAVGLLVGVVGVVVPLRIGSRTLRRMEF
jgi:ABC-2 type transport system permease protein